MKRMLIDAAHAEETRVVLLDGSRIDDFESETQGKQQHKGNIYIGTVSRVEPSLQAAFITYGGNRNGFLAFGETHPQHFALKPAEKAALLEELAENAARRRHDDDAEIGEGLETEKPARHSARAASHQSGRPHEHNGRRGRPQRVGSETPNLEAAPENVFEAHEEPLTHSIPTATPQEAPASAFYEDAEDAAAAQKAAAMADAMERGAGNSTDTKPKHHRKAGPGRPTKPEGEGSTDKSQGNRASGNGSQGKRRPKRMNARRPARITEGTAEGVAEPVAESAAPEATPAKTPKTKRPNPRAVKGRGRKAAPIQAGAEEVSVAPSPEATAPEKPTEADAERSRMSGISHGTVHRRFRIQDVLKEGQKILVQVVKEERGSKGAALTTYISLPGRYTVLMPNTPNAGGISRKITDGEERRALRDTYRALDVPSTMGVIIRTAGMGQDIQAIKADYANLQQLWSHITQAFDSHDDVQCLHEDGSILVRALRDMAGDEVDEIIISGQRAYKQAKDFARAFTPEALKKISLYKEEAPIFSHYNVESKLIYLHHERVQLPSGGSIVINPTEALVAIDINSGRNTSERNIEETAYKTNLEACEEIARQIRLRDLAGLIVVDFIDMENYSNTRKIEQAMRRALKRDRARIQTGGISEFGLMEISRQRLRPSFAENHTIKCAQCGGTGRMVSSNSAGLMLLRRLEEDDATGSDRIMASAATGTVMWILNHKRDLIRSLEEKYKYQLLFKADETLLAPDARLELTRMKADGSEASQTLNVEWREQPEVPPEKRYTKEGRAQRQREEEAREDLRNEKPDRTEVRAEPRTEQPRAERPERAPRAELEPRAERQKAETQPKTAQPVAAKPEMKAERKAESKERPTAPKAKKPALVAEDKPLAVQKVDAEHGSSPAPQPKAKPKMAIKVQPDTDRDLRPIAVAKVEADRSAVAAPKAGRSKKVALKTKDGETKAEKGILNRLLGI